jgi:hypothetical protein
LDVGVTVSIALSKNFVLNPKPLKLSELVATEALVADNALSGCGRPIALEI